MLPNDIIDVSSFMDAYVDVDLMDECGKDLAERFVSSKPNKILTIATTGLVIAIRESCFSLPSFLVTILSMISPHLTRCCVIGTHASKQWQNIYRFRLFMLESNVP